MTPLTELLPTTTALRHAAAHLRDRGTASGCGCPTWAQVVDPDAEPVPHRSSCPMTAVDEVFAAVSTAVPAVVSALNAGNGPAAAVRQVTRLNPASLVGGTVAVSLALAGLTRLCIHVEASRTMRVRDLSSNEIERFAVIEDLTRDESIPLGAETLVRMLLGGDPATDLDRMTQLLSVTQPVTLADLDVAELLVSVFLALNARATELAGGSALPDALSLDNLASEGFNLMCGIRSASDVAETPRAC